MMNEREKRLIEENMNKLEVTIKALAGKFNIGHDEFEDYRQTAYLTLCNKSFKYNGSTQFVTFANTVIVNAMIDKYRSDRHKNIETVSLDDTYTESDVEPTLMDYLASETNTENEVLARITNDMLQKYINNAKDKCSAKTTVQGFEALELKLQGYSSAEIASMFNVPSNAIRSWMSRAKKLLLCEKGFVELIKG